MADSTPEKPAPTKDEPPPAAEATATPSKSGGLGAWLPLIVTVVSMPALAYAMTSFVLLPKMKKELAATAGAPPAEAAPATGHESPTPPKPPASEQAKPKEKGEAKEKGEGKEKGVSHPGGKTTVSLEKILVNVAGSMGSRYLVASVALAGATPNFEETVKGNEAQLLDLAAGILSSKTVADLEKPAARNIVRSELLTVFNNALGAGTVQDIYLTEFAVQ